MLQVLLLTLFSLGYGGELLLQKSNYPQNSASIRVLLKPPTEEAKCYGLEMGHDQVDDLNTFLSSCNEEKKEGPFEVGVVAVGDFVLDEMKDLISNHFGTLNLQEPKGYLSADSSTMATEYAETMVIPDPDPALVAFYQLSLDIHEKKTIHYIIYTMAHKNVVQLGWKKKSLEKRGKKIQQVHPLRFLGYVFSDRELSYCMHEIKKSHFKWYGFLDGFCKKMKEESRSNNLAPFVAGFAQHLNVDPATVMSYINKDDFEGLVRYLM